MRYLVFALLLMLTYSAAFGQEDSTAVEQDSTVYRIVKNDGQELIGMIISSDAREVLFKTLDGREFYVPQHVIKEIEPLDSSSYNSRGEYVGEDKFATRYFITTNGLPIKKGEHYIQWNLFGPDFQFGLGKNFGVGVMASWIGMPLIGTIKKSWELGDKTQFAVGGLVGTGTWIAPEWGGALPFATLSFGSRKSNIAFSGGYGAVWFGDGAQGRALASVAGMVKVAPKVSLVFDSFILLPGPVESYTQTYYDGNQYLSQQIERRDPAIALLVPGVRFHTSPQTAFQFGFTGIAAQGEFWPVPIPMVQWYRSLK
ncbi:MAG: hypothetical protein NXI10_13730 [bacterium]|nr:hypothetical protein [bacterium]